MIDQALLGELRDAAPRHNVSEVESIEAQQTVDSVRQALVRSPGGRWWWDRLQNDAVVIEYGQGDGLAILDQLIREVPSVWLVPTDDEDPPWPVFEGKPESVLDLLKESRFFEYFLTDASNAWAAFDTHHNTVVVTGALVDKAKEIKDALK